MSELADLHNAAMDLASLAEAARRSGDEQRAQALFRDALEYERQAALKVASNVNAEPTRSVLLRSAASLALDCNSPREAEQLIATALAGDPPDEIAEELRDLYETATFRRHLQVSGKELRPGEVQLSLSGDAVGFGVIDAEEYSTRIEAVENLLLRTAERRQKLKFRERGRPSKVVTKDFGMYLTVPRAASFAVTIKVGRPEKQKKLEGFGDESDTLSEFLDCMALFSDERIDELRERIGDNAYYRNFVSLAKKIAPDGQRIRTVGFTATEGEDCRRIAIQGRPSEKWTRKAVQQRRVIQLIGTLTSAQKDPKRADRNLIGIRDEKGITRTVLVPKGMMNDIVRPHWDNRVMATCFTFRDKYKLMDLQPLEDVPPVADVPPNTDTPE